MTLSHREYPGSEIMQNVEPLEVLHCGDRPIAQKKNSLI